MLIYSEIKYHRIPWPWPWPWFLLVVALGLAIQFYQQRNEARQFAQPLEVFPELYLEYSPPSDSTESPDYSGLFVRVQNDRKAFGVKLTAPIVIGENHKRMGSLLDVPAQVGRDRVPVAVRCAIYRKDRPDICDPIGGFKGEQLEEFPKRKADRPDEITVSADYLDVDGRKCPTRRFRRFMHRNETNAIREVRCEPAAAAGARP